MQRRDVLKMAVMAVTPVRLVAESRPVKVFAIGDYDFVAAYSKEQAIDWYCREFGVRREDIGTDPDIWEVGQKGMDTLKVVDEDTGTEWTFREYLTVEVQPDQSVPYLFCSSGW